MAGVVLGAMVFVMFLGLWTCTYVPKLILQCFSKSGNCTVIIDLLQMFGSMEFSWGIEFIQNMTNFIRLILNICGTILYGYIVTTHLILSLIVLTHLSASGTCSHAAVQLRWHLNSEIISPDICQTSPSAKIYCT